ncbi:polysaccharide biosynthesis/export family protein [Pedobacter metabolipauper]|uniref:polysaccharide biosynthesis/export family protein n=1 Tax=Pedobacter metabolipauper TaxID=425513 RepID=UPI001FB6DEBE|nr:polysaccharide biosynthesis/export family protein [Pedobacter metabolipauper]
MDSSKVRQLNAAAFNGQLIQPDDILNITIQTVDPAATTVVNQTPAAASSGASDGISAINGFLVDEDGNVEVPVLGVVKLSGMTTTKARGVIRSIAARYYKNPTVQVRFSNFKITVLGEVNKPASYTMPNEKVTVLDAIAFAGDLTIYGKRDNILLIRDNGDKKDVIRINLNSSDLISSPYFNLKQNDVIYVEPNKARIAVNSAPTRQLITMTLSIVAVVITILSRF